ncbi:hypothetical protein HYW35_00470 [Candidatus Saccharibacteria bacterium]|nr:hypothetical protein [Candidatus Saccharibacteria bacterium]
MARGKEMTGHFSFTLHRSAFTMRYPFTVNKWLMTNGKCTENGKWLTLNGSGGAVDV